MAQLLPGPEDVGKHLFEISPGRPEPTQLCAGPSGPSGVLPPLEPGKGRALRDAPALSVNTAQKRGSNLENMVNLG